MTAEDEGRRWLAERVPPGPSELTDRLDVGPAAGAPWSVLTEAALLWLQEAAGLPGRDREAAYRLLAADALLTYACEAAADEEDVEAALRRILERVGAAAP